MVFRVSGKNIEVGDALRRRVSERIRGATSKYFDGGFSGHATVAKDGFGYHTECVVHLDSGVTLEAEGMSADAYDSADLAATHIEKRLRRYKRKRTEHRADRKKRSIK
jgi:ribosomal subunit interface protein